MTNPLDLLLSRLDGIKRTARGTYAARCPAHGDKHPSLAVKELEDGVLLVHCFAGCDTAEVITAAGLELSDLFPPRNPDGRKPERRPFNAADLLHLAAWESLIASIISSDIALGNLSESDRLLKAAARLQRMVEVANVR